MWDNFVLGELSGGIDFSRKLCALDLVLFYFDWNEHFLNSLFCAKVWKKILIGLIRKSRHIIVA